MLKHRLMILAAAAVSVASCGSIGQYSEAGRFQDGIYYTPRTAQEIYTPLTEEEIEDMVAMQLQSEAYDSVDVADLVDDGIEVNVYNIYGYGPYGRFGWYGPYSWYGSPYGWYGGLYSWYDPYWYDPFWYDPIWDPWWYGPYMHGPMPMGPGFGGGNFQYASHAGRTMSSAGIVSRAPTSIGNIRTVASRSNTRAAVRDMTSLRRSAGSMRTTSQNRVVSQPEVGRNVRSTAATRGGYPASNNGNVMRSSARSNDSWRSSGGNYRSSGGSFGGGGFSGGGMSHSSGGGGGMSHGGGGHR